MSRCQCVDDDLEVARTLFGDMCDMLTSMLDNT
jgi:hypothetical protein